MDEYRRRLNRTEIKLCALLTALLFGGLIVLPHTGQVIWTVIIAAAYFRVTLVIARREELLEEQCPAHEGSQRSAWRDAGARRIESDPKGAQALCDGTHSGRQSAKIFL